MYFAPGLGLLMRHYGTFSSDRFCTEVQHVYGSSIHRNMLSHYCYATCNINFPIIITVQALLTL